MTESEFIKWLLENRDFISRSLSSKSIASLSDFYFGFVVRLHLEEALLIGFQTWLGVELGFLKPSAARGGLWIGDSITWGTMLLRAYDNDSGAYDAFFTKIAAYNDANKHNEVVFPMDGYRKCTSLINDYGSGLPHTLNAYSLEGHDGVYVQGQYENGIIRMIGYFSDIEEVEIQVDRTKTIMTNSS